jgi:hypothetical protein
MNLFNMSWEEKSTWASLLIILLVFTGYFSQVFEGLAADTLDRAEVSGLFIGAVVSVIVLEILLHIVIAVFNVRDADQPRDERDRQFSMKAGNISGWVLGAAVLTIALHAFMYENSSIWVANLLLFAVFVSQIVSYSLQLFYYRRGY